MTQKIIAASLKQFALKYPNVFIVNNQEYYIDGNDFKNDFSIYFKKNSNNQIFPSFSSYSGRICRLNIEIDDRNQFEENKKDKKKIDFINKYNGSGNKKADIDEKELFNEEQSGDGGDEEKEIEGKTQEESGRKFKNLRYYKMQIENMNLYIFRIKYSFIEKFNNQLDDIIDNFLSFIIDRILNDSKELYYCAGDDYSFIHKSYFDLGSLLEDENSRINLIERIDCINHDNGNGDLKIIDIDIIPQEFISPSHFIKLTNESISIITTKNVKDQITMIIIICGQNNTTNSFESYIVVLGGSDLYFNCLHSMHKAVYRNGFTFGLWLNHFNNKEKNTYFNERLNYFIINNYKNNKDRLNESPFTTYNKLLQQLLYIEKDYLKKTNSTFGVKFNYLPQETYVSNRKIKGSQSQENSLVDTKNEANKGQSTASRENNDSIIGNSNK